MDNLRQHQDLQRIQESSNYQRQTANDFNGDEDAETLSVEKLTERLYFPDVDTLEDWIRTDRVILVWSEFASDFLSRVHFRTYVLGAEHIDPIIREIAIGYLDSRFTDPLPSKLQWTLSDHVIRFCVQLILLNTCPGGIWQEWSLSTRKEIENLAMMATELLAFLVDGHAEAYDLPNPPFDLNRLSIGTGDSSEMDMSDVFEDEAEEDMYDESDEDMYDSPSY